MRIPFWASAAVLLLGLIAIAYLLSPRSRINQANFDLIYVGMDETEVEQILGTPEGRMEAGGSHSVYLSVWHWTDGPNSITVVFDGKSRVRSKRTHLATAWETATWHVKLAAKKVGINW
jgi:hypothetical protein